MPINQETLLNWTFNDISHEYTEKDTILYALGLGLGTDPLSSIELQHVYEKALKTLPTMAVVMGTLGLWVKNPATGITWKKLVHSAQSAQFHNPLPAAGKVISKASIVEVYDNGERGAVIIVRRKISDASSNTQYCTLDQTLMLRADGGFDGTPLPRPATSTLKDSSPDISYEWRTTQGQAILYRLSGDWNPLHIDPDIASNAGFRKPILHGYCSYGIAGWAACQAMGLPSTAVKQLECRFTYPVYPGDTLQFKFWKKTDKEYEFQALVDDKPVLNNGKIIFS